MDVLDLPLERLCDRVTLVQGVGDRRRGRLCVMSFVALLAGEDHSDHPACASPLIRGVALPVNDALPLRERQCLKAFVARIVGTADGCDAARAEVLRRVLADEILPSVRRDFCDRQAEGPRRAPFEFLWAGSVGRDLEARIVRLLARCHGEGLWTCSWASLGSAAGELLALCMREATTRERRRWYWGAAIGLLDRLCDVGAEDRAPAAIQDNRLERAEALLAHARGRVGFNAGAAVRRLCPASAGRTIRDEPNPPRAPRPRCLLSSASALAGNFSAARTRFLAEDPPYSLLAARGSRLPRRGNVQRENV